MERGGTNQQQKTKLILMEKKVRMQYRIPPQLYASHPSHEQKQKLPTNHDTKISRTWVLGRIREQTTVSDQEESC